MILSAKHFLRNILGAPISRTGLLVLFAFFCGRSLFAEDQPDAVMRYYLEGVDSVLSSKYIFVSQKSFSCRVTSILTVTDYHGRTDKADTAVYNLFYSEKSRDSIVALDSAGHEDNIFAESFKLPQLWSDDLHYYFFPNDTGAGRLAIGFDNLGGENLDNPVGFVNFDRNDFWPESIFIHYPGRKGGGSRRWSENYFFDMKDGLIRLKSYEKMSVEIHFMGRQYSHLRIEVDNYLGQ